MCRQLKWALLISLPTVYLLAECLKSLDFKSSCIETNQTTSSSVLVNQSMWKWIRMLISPHISTLPVYLWELDYWIVFLLGYGGMTFRNLCFCSCIDQCHCILQLAGSSIHCADMWSVAIWEYIHIHQQNSFNFPFNFEVILSKFQVESTT